MDWLDDAAATADGGSSALPPGSPVPAKFNGGNADKYMGEGVAEADVDVAADVSGAALVLECRACGEVGFAVLELAAALDLPSLPFAVALAYRNVPGAAAVAELDKSGATVGAALGSDVGGEYGSDCCAGNAC